MVDHMGFTTKYPTKEHENAAKAIVDFFSTIPKVEAIILYGSCARGKASKDSCLDILIIVPPEVLGSDRDFLEKQWEEHYNTEDVFRSLSEIGRYSHVDLDIINGCFKPGHHGWTTGPDEFELEIGNTLLYSNILWRSGPRLDNLRSKWLPYYDEELRDQRLAMVKQYCKNNLDHIPLYVDRGLYFQSFDRLYNAYKEFLQALFISVRKYPISYDKWIKEQIEDILGKPELYIQLRNIINIHDLESDEIETRSKILGQLFHEYISDSSVPGR